MQIPQFVKRVLSPLEMCSSEIVRCVNTNAAPDALQHLTASVILHCWFATNWKNEFELLDNHFIPFQTKNQLCFQYHFKIVFAVLHFVSYTDQKITRPIVLLDCWIVEICRSFFFDVIFLSRLFSVV